MILSVMAALFRISRQAIEILAVCNCFYLDSECLVSVHAALLGKCTRISMRSHIRVGLYHRPALANESHLLAFGEP